MISDAEGQKRGHRRNSGLVFPTGIRYNIERYIWPSGH